MKIYLLSHARELKKESNSGRVVKECLGETVEIIVWKRTEPSQELVELIARDEMALLYPDGDDGPERSLQDFENFLVLDGTWQEARKMYNLSPYLQRARRVTLAVTEPSSYSLRRNQIIGGMSTAECAIEILRLKEQTTLAEKVAKEFDRFNTK